MQVILFGVGPLALGFLLDLCLGDPPWLYHPVRAMGALIEFLEKWLRRLQPNTPSGLQMAGVQLTLFSVILTLAAYLGLLALASLLGDAFSFVLQTFLCYQLLAVRDLRAHSLRVYKRLRAQDLPGARKALAMIVGRDTEELEEDGVIRAAVETVAENTGDGVVAPLFFMALGGPVLGAVYKMINTLDSMVGYKNERYLHLGRASAKADDAAGWLPSRLAALCMMGAAGVCDLDWKQALAVWKRDRRAHQSPNSGQTEAACAGALGIRLGGPSSYEGQLVEKPWIGDGDRPPERDDILAANNLMLFTAIIALFLCCILRVLVLALLF